MSDNEFQVGDRVVIVDSLYPYYAPNGMTGTVVEIGENDPDYIGVKIDDPRKSDNTYVWTFRIDEIEKA